MLSFEPATAPNQAEQQASDCRRPGKNASLRHPIERTHKYERTVAGRRDLQQPSQSTTECRPPIPSTPLIRRSRHSHPWEWASAVIPAAQSKALYPDPPGQCPIPDTRAVRLLQTARFREPNRRSRMPYPARWRRPSARIAPDYSQTEPRDHQRIDARAGAKWQSCL